MSINPNPNNPLGCNVIYNTELFSHHILCHYSIRFDACRLPYSSRKNPHCIIYPLYFVNWEIAEAGYTIIRVMSPLPLPDYMVQQPRRQPSSYLLLWDPEISVDGWFPAVCVQRKKYLYLYNFCVVFIQTNSQWEYLMTNFSLFAFTEWH
jgi:hypothetical protein